MDAKFFQEVRQAIRDGDTEAVVALVGSDALKLHMDTPFGSWLHQASSFGQLRTVEALLELGIDPNLDSGILGGNALNAAASNGRTAVVQHLLSSGTSMDVSDPKRNPLFGAIYRDSLDIVKLLVESGIDIHVKYTGESMKNMDALAFAEEWGRTEIANYLRKQLDRK